jgi:hypothetical protein
LRIGCLAKISGANTYIVNCLCQLTELYHLSSNSNTLPRQTAVFVEKKRRSSRGRLLLSHLPPLSALCSLWPSPVFFFFHVGMVE